MPSVSYHEWSTRAIAALNEIENAHRSVGGTGRGRRYATQQINQAYAVLLSSQFQKFCRDLHTECVNHLVPSTTPVAFQTTLSTLLIQDRKLDRGNPNPGNVGSDFGRLGIRFWREVNKVDGRNPARQALLEELNAWRNAIAHQDFAGVTTAGTMTLTLQQVRRWRRACEALAVAFDAVMHAHILGLTGTPPW
jgi:RiboL-PSP-HEPN